MNLYLLRHGETAHNRDGVGLGRRDEPLTALGTAQAAAVAQRLAEVTFTRIISSPLSRASATAAAVAEGRAISVELRDELLEMDVGLTEGMAFSAVREQFPQFVTQWAGEQVGTAVMPGGESLADVAQRLAPLITELRESPPEATLLLVSHNFVVKVLLCSLLGVELAAFRAFEVGLASLSSLIVRGARVNVVMLNDLCHLACLNLDQPGRSV